MPNTAYFKDDQKYYSTLFHEIIHWTGHESRLNRFGNTAPTSEKYAVEELIAEMGAMLIYFDKYSTPLSGFTVSAQHISFLECKDKGTCFCSVKGV
ncbi:MAG: hypothetical protein EOP33_09935 [Rickettsiaceae bacterium]|nr:MAG: hypothetical protein EOP33_09935 [Rickettsiaceae bacterium]